MDVVRGGAQHVTRLFLHQGTHSGQRGYTGRASQERQWRDQRLLTVTGQAGQYRHRRFKCSSGNGDRGTEPRRTDRQGAASQWRPEQGPREEEEGRYVVQDGSSK